MSFEATRAAWRIEFPKRLEASNGHKVKGSSCKFVLLALAEHANKHGNAWPSITTIARSTGLDRKTVVDSIAALADRELIKSAGMAKGKTGRVPIYRVLPNGPENGTISADLMVPFSTPNGPENGTANGPENGTQNQ